MQEFIVIMSKSWVVECLGLSGEGDGPLLTDVVLTDGTVV